MQDDPGLKRWADEVQQWVLTATDAAVEIRSELQELEDWQNAVNQNMQMMANLLVSLTKSLGEAEDKIEALENKKCRCEYTIGGRNTYGGIR